MRSVANEVGALSPAVAIQDPAARRFAQSVADMLRAMNSARGAAQMLGKAAESLASNPGATPPSVAQWLFSSELYAKLSASIDRIDVAAKQEIANERIERILAITDEANLRASQISQLAAQIADISGSAEYDPIERYQPGFTVTYGGALYRAKLETTGNAPTNSVFWEKIGDYASFGDAILGLATSVSDLEQRVSSSEGLISAESNARETLAAQLRGPYQGSDINAVTTGLLYSERVARASADESISSNLSALSSQMNIGLDQVRADIATEQTTRASADESLAIDLQIAQAASINAHALTSASSSIEQIARATADEATASTVTLLSARTDTTEAMILDEQSVRASNDLAIVSAVNTALAQITGVSAAISQDGQNLVANWTQAQATKWSQIEAEVLAPGGQTIRAALAEESSVRASFEGQVSSTWMIRAQVDAGTGKPYIAGVALGAEGQAEGGATSQFIIRADKFAMVMPGYGEHVPFAIGPGGASFSGETNWSKVSGPGKPENNATVGADIAENVYRGGVEVLESDFVATWNKITSANVTTYINNLAINEAVIGTAAITTAKIKDGAIVRAKIGVAEIDTLRLAGQSVQHASGNVVVDTSSTSITVSFTIAGLGASESIPLFIHCGLDSANMGSGNSTISHTNPSGTYQLHSGVNDNSYVGAVGYSGNGYNRVTFSTTGLASGTYRRMSVLVQAIKR